MLQNFHHCYMHYIAFTRAASARRKPEIGVFATYIWSHSVSRVVNHFRPANTCVRTSWQWTKEKANNLYARRLRLQNIPNTRQETLYASGARVPQGICAGAPDVQVYCYVSCARYVVVCKIHTHLRGTTAFDGKCVVACGVPGKWLAPNCAACTGPKENTYSRHARPSRVELHVKVWCASCVSVCMCVSGLICNSTSYIACADDRKDLINALALIARTHTHTHTAN